MAGETSREIDQAAAQWAARLDRAPLSPGDQAALDAWLQGDIRRLGAYAKARAVAVHSLRAAALTGGDLERAALQDIPQLDRRVLLAASIGAGMVGGAGLMAACWRKAQSFETRKGEVRTIALDDGSSMMLNTLSRASVRYGRDTREIVLTFGEALFTVVRDSRPFVVQAAGTAIIAGSGRFVVRRLEQAPLSVLALDSAVQLRPRGASLLRVEPSRAVALEEGVIQEVAVDAAAVDRALAWRDRRLAFQNGTLRDAVAEFARFSDTRIEIADPAVADLRITGLFRADDPVAFVRAVTISLNLHATVGPDVIRLRRGTI
ncbi:MULTISPECIES: FecR family protein [unclassified Brevundimonas]|uniref:FecR family protein n=1 Tax=unclassified Brevundimonas TaxID=2622653 RepID=UPI003F933FD9